MECGKSGGEGKIGQTVTYTDSVSVCNILQRNIEFPKSKRLPSSTVSALKQNIEKLPLRLVRYMYRFIACLAVYVYHVTTVISIIMPNHIISIHAILVSMPFLTQQIHNGI